MDITLALPIILGCLIFSIKCHDIHELVGRANVPIENHYVTTEDGYILNIFRLPQSKPTKIIFLMHGLTSSAPMFLLTPNESAGFFFYSLGYDVWLGNARGNKYSRNHTTLDPEKRDFWEFSWHDIGFYDLKAMIDFCLLKTGLTQLDNYIGHSQGVTSIFVLLTERPEYNAKIKLLHAMTPPIIMKYYNKYIPLSAKNLSVIENWTKMIGHYDILPYERNKSLFNMLVESCHLPLLKDMCKRSTEIIMGPFAPSSYQNGFLEEMLEHMPAGASYRQLLHYMQIGFIGRFQKFDFGPEENQRLYGSIEPPEYNYSNIQTPLHILYGTNDYLVPAANIPILLKKIEHTLFAVDKFHQYNHINFANGRLVKFVQQRILKTIEKFEQEMTPTEVTTDINEQ